MPSLIPNSFQTPNFYVDELQPFLEPEEFSVLVYFARQIFGWNKRAARISLSDIVEHTGMSRPTAIRAVDSLIGFGLVVVLEENDGRNEGRLFSIQMSVGDMNIAALNARRDKVKSANTARTENARKERSESGKSDIPLPPKKDAKERSVAQTGPGKSDIPLPPKKSGFSSTKNEPINLSFKPKSLKAMGGNIIPPLPPLPPYIHNDRPKQKGKTGDSELYPTTKIQLAFFAKLQAQFRADNKKGPEKFPTLEVKERFAEVEKRLGDKVPYAMADALAVPIMSVSGIVAYMRKWTGKPRGMRQPNGAGEDAVKKVAREEASKKFHG